jgi:hypothetical protein
MVIDHTLKRSLSKALTDAQLLDLPEKLIGKRFLFAYDINGQIGVVCGEIRGIEYSMAAGLHLFVSSPALDTFKLMSLSWNPETAAWSAIIELDQAELLMPHAQGHPRPALNCIPGQFEIII